MKLLNISLIVLGSFSMILGLLTPLSSIIFVTIGFLLLILGITRNIIVKFKNNKNNSIINSEERLRQLEKLKKEELLSDEEYEEKRTQILNEL